MRQRITAQKTLKKLLLFSLIVSNILFSCKKFDTNASVLHEENFAQKFFETKLQPGPEVATIIELLKAENERTGFVNKLPKYCGLPVWEKILITRQPENNAEITYSSASHGPSYNEEFTEGSSSTVIIPLSINNSNLSSLVVATISSSDVTVNCYTANDDLYNTTHGSNVDTTAATKSLVLFFYMENRTYGSTTFYNLPEDLFPHVTSLDSTIARP
jgi:hypothetical protein